ncbi:MAG TPA: sigma-70 family RNA polymerase sigma factor [Terriglobales bacterium]|jgi:RNA polymerase sigma-70 factor, ECF subfamily|nr:sigma-70 family RNA polymerase sigma factor [Terriglobales bacterium]
MATAVRAPAVEGGSELLLVNAARAGDVEAFGELVKRYDRQVFRVVRHLTENPQDAEDIVQEAFVKAFCNIKSFEGRSAFCTWLIRIAVNEALGRIRHRQKFPHSSLEFTASDDETVFELQIASSAASPEDLCNDGELRRALARAIHRLRPRLRAVFVLRDVQGMSAQETAEILRITVGTVKARLFRARQRLRQMLAPYVATLDERSRGLAARGTAAGVQ